MALIDIYNAALLRAGSPPLVSLADTSKARRDCETSYTIQRPALLRSYRWPFALRRTSLAPLPDPPAFGFTKRMRLPDDCLMVVAASPYKDAMRITLTADPTTYRVEGGDLHTDHDEMFLLYVADVTNPAEFDALFTKTLTLLIASDLALSLSNDRQLHEQLRTQAEQELLRARRMNALEQPAEVVETYGLFGVPGRSGVRRETVGPAYYTPESEPI